MRGERWEVRRWRRRMRHVRRERREVGG